MSFEIKTAHVEQYKANVDIPLQQRGSRLRQGVMVDNDVVGKRKFYEQIGTIEVVARQSRHSDTPLTPHPHARRALDLVTFEAADLIDNDDQVRMLIDPESSYSQSIAMAMGRQMDRVIITAATGNANTGVSGGTSTAHGAGQQIAVTYDEAGGSGTNFGLTIGKLRRARNLLTTADVPEDEDLFIAVRAQQIQDLLQDDELTSVDFNTVKALVNGEINQYLGFTFLNTQLLTNSSSTDITTVLVWARSGIKLGIGREPAGKITERPDKSYSVQVYYAMDIGATRMEEEKVVDIQCDESP